MVRLRFLIVVTVAISTLAACGGGNSNPANPSAMPPGAPTNVLATANVRGASLSWTPPTVTGGSAFTGYSVSFLPATLGAAVAIFGSTATVTGLLNGTTYTFTVTAANTVGTGPPSTPSNPVTTPDVPGAPTNVAASPGVQAATLTWASPADTGGRPLTGFTVLVSPAVPSALFQVAGTTATVSNLAVGTYYTFRVFATTEVGDGPVSASSSPVAPLTPPSAPGQPTVASGNAQVSRNRPGNHV
jgi:hypothetical protein